jgi:hypothetical protein
MSDASVKNMIRTLVGMHDIVSVFDAKVNSVDETARMCEVTIVTGKSSNILPVRLMASVDDGCLLIPKVDSTVVVTMSEYVEPYISMYSEIERIVWLGGEYDGVPIVTHPTDNTKGLLSKINGLENLLNDLILKFNAHTHVLTLSAGTGTAAPTTTQEIQSIHPITTQIDIEHPNIIH